MLRLTRYRGTISLQGSWVESTAMHLQSDTVPSEAHIDSSNPEANTERYHITLLTAAEVKTTLDKLNFSELAHEVATQQTSIEQFIVALGLAEQTSATAGHSAWYVPIVSCWADTVRANLHLPAKDFHITCGYLGAKYYGQPEGSHQFSLKNIRSWASSNCIASAVLNITTALANTAAMDQLLVKYLNFLHDLSHNIITQLEDANNVALSRSILIRALKEAAKCSLHLKRHSTYKASPVVANTVLHWDIAYFLLSHGVPFGLKLLINCGIIDHCTDFRIYDRHLPQRVDEMQLQAAIAAGQSGTFSYLLREVNQLVLHHSTSPAWASKTHQVFAYDPEEAIFHTAALPRNFSWVQLLPAEEMGNPLGRFLLAGCAFPTEKEQIAAMSSVGIRHIITIHEKPLLRTATAPTTGDRTEMVNVHSTITQEHLDTFDVTAHYFSVIDRTPPTLQQTVAMCDIIHEAVCQRHGVVVHCQGGVGRTNTVLIAYLIRTYNMSASEAITAVTEQRKIILAESQKGFLRRWWEHCNNERTSKLEQSSKSIQVAALPAAALSYAGAVFPPLLLEYNSYVKKATAMKLPRLLILCGLPASGKSTFARTLCTACPEFFIRINKDEMRGKGQCEDVLFDAIRNNNKRRCIIIDCCNVTAKKRSEWLDLAHKPCSWCIFFNIPVDTCKQRIQLRADHPTIQAGSSGIKIIDSMKKQFESPLLPQFSGAFERIIEIKNSNDVNDLLHGWGIRPAEDTSASAVLNDVKPETQSSVEAKLPANIAAADDVDSLLKFPRTAHILNLGAATRDDKILPASDLNHIITSGREVLIEEKLDGANMGIFIRSSDLRIVAQNRSHFVTSKYHPQFAPLDQWLAKHTQDLWQILEPGRHILYGEWLYATHSVEYTRLPGWFVAYDLYDRQTGRFVSRDHLASLLAETSIPHVPLIYRGLIESTDQLIAMVDGPSAYNDARREGFVLRLVQQFHEDEALELRAKLVRSDFIAGNERWNKSSVIATNRTIFS